jgi:hypothetical protein
MVQVAGEGLHFEREKPITEGTSWTGHDVQYFVKRKKITKALVYRNGHLLTFLIALWSFTFK